MSFLFNLYFMLVYYFAFVNGFFLYIEVSVTPLDVVITPLALESTSFNVTSTFRNYQVLDIILFKSLTYLL
jgi:hypothetical protein